MRIKFLSLSFILGMLSLNGFSQIYVPGGVVHTSNSSSLVGIGTSAPVATLHVAGNIYLPANKSIWMGGTSDTGNRLRFGEGSGAGYQFIDYYPTLHFRTGADCIATFAMTLLSNGNVGIGAMSPLTKFQIGNIWTFYDGSNDKIIGRNTYYNGSSNVRIQQGVAARMYFGGSGDIVFQTAGSGLAGSTISSWNTMIMNNEGNVGIGTSAPLSGKKLHVQGDSYFSGKLGIGTVDPKVQMQIGNIWTFYDGPNDKIIGRNTYYNGSSNVRIQQGIASRMYFSGSGDIVFQTAGSGAAGSIISAWNTLAMNYDGNVCIGTSAPFAGKKLHVQGDSYFSGSMGIGTTSTGEYKLKVNGKINCTELVVSAGIGVSSGIQGHSGVGEIEWPDYVFAEDYKLRDLDEVASFIHENQRLPEMPSAADVAEKGINIGEVNALLLKKVEELTLYILQQNDDIQSLKAEVQSLKEGR